MQKVNLEEVYMKYADELYSYIAGMTGNKHDSEELLQDIFVKLSTRQLRNNITNIRAYLYSCARNSVISFINKVKRSKRDIHFVPSMDHNQTNQQSLEITEALDKLPPEQKEIIILKIYQNMTFQEIANTLSLPADTAASRYRYAIGKLKETLSGSQN